MNNRLRVLRAERKMSQAVLAELLDVSRQTVNAIELGKHDPSLLLAFKVSQVFGLPVEQIFDPGLHGEAKQAAE
ncbi:helix-turn-helix transcriptional regulator [Alteraurantiacibacter aquimixticola]|uniref:Transcriptional regulator n=1 Tax=Alteraurantiacibacter aquimixticola TaxID=2489173 RepID=A0A4T3EYY6_9SPHN|nr:helix-turn-helix transcriptional regulator [Alteraurantiacibacter aquimixticola]TIX49079.1 transcriptional regulator [Alteraurantiacibacter aquimixticola]